MSLFKYGSRLQVHGRNSVKSLTFKIGSPRSIQSSNFRPLRSSSNKHSFDVGMNGFILKMKLFNNNNNNKTLFRFRYLSKIVFKVVSSE